MSLAKTARIESLDVLRGLVMVIMALDHVRDYFYFETWFGDPTNLATTTPILFFTRFITNFCAPVFVFLSGTSAFLYGTNKSKKQVFNFLFTRGLWLIFLELVVNSLIWTFDLSYSVQIVQVIFAIGVSMICLSLLIYLPKAALFAVGLLLVAGHNALDGIVLSGQGLDSIVWYFLHQQTILYVGAHHTIILFYPLIPWVGLMALGYLFGWFYQADFDREIRKKWLLTIGLACLALFFILRGINLYGDLVPWAVQDSATKTVLSFFNATKYPPSLLYLCLFIGPAMLLLYAIDTTKNKVSDFFLVFGRVPLFYYFAHVLLIHVLAIVSILIFGGNWQDMIINNEGWRSEALRSYGFSLLTVYLVWISVIFMLYPFCKRYMAYKSKHKDQWWLSYL